VRIVVSHNRSKAEVVKAIDESFDKAFQEAAALPAQVVVEDKTWHGSTLSFALKAKKGFLSTQIKGTAEVSDKDVTIDADLGMLSRFVSEDTAKEMIGNRIRRMLR
jgi:Putative polyhydroxyalkanoic acid system protein (PHA_gran_rgn)